MPESIGSASVEIEPDLAPFERSKAAFAAAGAAVGAVLVQGITDSLEEGKIVAKLGAQLGKTPAEAHRFGKIAGELYAGAVTTDFQQAADTIRSVMGAGLIPAASTNAQIKSISTNVADLANTFDFELGETATAVGQLIKTGMARNAKEGLNLLTVGLQGTDERAKDLLDTISEYGTVFKTAGIGGRTAIGLIRQALQAGAKDTDNIADALKEFTLKAVTDAKPVQEAFKTLGLSGKQIGADVGAGGTRAENAIGKVLEALQKMPATAARATVIQDLFGGPGEDLGAAIFALNINKARSSMDNAAGSADKLGNSLRDNAGARLDKFVATLRQGVTEVVGNQVIPALITFIGWLRKVGAAFSAAGSFVAANSTAFIVAAGVITTVMLPSLVRLATQASVTTGSVVAGWVAQSIAAISHSAIFIAQNVRVLAGWVAQGAAAVASAARTVASWAVIGARAVAGAAIQVFSAGVVVASWILMGVQSMIQAARMAAAWLIALGPIGIVIAIVIALVALIIVNWETIKNATVAAWNWVVNAVSVSIAAVKTAVSVSIAAIKSAWNSAWNAVKSVASSVWNSIVSNVSGAINSVRSVVSSGVNAVRSAVSSAFNTARSIASSVWNSIRSVISSAMSSARSAVSSAVSSIGSALSSIKGRVMGALAGAAGWLIGAGRDIIRGLLSGLNSMAGAVAARARQIASSAVSAAKNALGIGSPSKVFRQIGRDTGRGFIIGLTSTQSKIKQTADGIAKSITKAFAGRRTTVDDRLVTMVQRSNTRLQNLAAERDKIAARIAEAQKFATDVAGKAAGTGALSSLIQPDFFAPRMIESRLAGAANRIRAFTNALTTLRKQGLSKALMSQLLEMGPQAGLDFARSLAAQGVAGVKRFNALQERLGKEAARLGKFGADAMFDSGKKAGAGFLTGLKAQQKSIEALMLNIAKGMQKAIRRALGIRSPSAVMAEVGRQTTLGVAMGLVRPLPAVERAMGAVSTAIAGGIATPAPFRTSALTGLAGSRSALQAAAPATVHLTIENHGVLGSEQEVMDWLTKSIDTLNRQRRLPALGSG